MLNPNPNANPNAAAVTLTLTHPHISWRARLLPHRQALDDPRDATGTTRLRHPTGGLVYGVNATGLERLDASWFVNHGEDPNVRYCEATGEDVFNRYITTRTVRAGGAAAPPQHHRAHLLRTDRLSRAHAPCMAVAQELPLPYPCPNPNPGQRSYPCGTRTPEPQP